MYTCIRQAYATLTALLTMPVTYKPTNVVISPFMRYSGTSAYTRPVPRGRNSSPLRPTDLRSQSPKSPHRYFAPSQSCRENQNSSNCRLASILYPRRRPHHPPRCKYGCLVTGKTHLMCGCYRAQATPILRSLSQQ